MTTSLLKLSYLTKVPPWIYATVHFIVRDSGFYCCDRRSAPLMALSCVLVPGTSNKEDKVPITLLKKMYLEMLSAKQQPIFTLLNVIKNLNLNLLVVPLCAACLHSREWTLPPEQLLLIHKCNEVKSINLACTKQCLGEMSVCCFKSLGISLKYKPSCVSKRLVIVHACGSSVYKSGLGSDCYWHVWWVAPAARELFKLNFIIVVHWNKTLSCWLLGDHWRHWKLSHWQCLMPSVMTKLYYDINIWFNGNNINPIQVQ